MLDAAHITALRGLAREVRELAYTGGYEKENALLNVANRLNEAVVAMETVALAQ